MVVVGVDDGINPVSSGMEDISAYSGRGQVA